MVFIDPIVKEQLQKIKRNVKKHDRDWVAVFDGEEGSGKSVLAMQVAKELDPNFNLDNLVFNAEQFIDRLKKAPKYSCILLDEAYNAANAKSTLSEVNKALIGVATEMRQRNLFVLIVLPTFFDLDKYFAIWRCRTLFHAYFNKNDERGQYIIFPKKTKKFLFLLGKKFYDYSKPKSPYPPCRFTKEYVVDEYEYRKKKQEAFQKRQVSNLAKRWKAQRDSLIKEMYHNLKFQSLKIPEIMLNWGARPVSQREIQRIVQLYQDNDSNEDIDEGVSYDDGDKAT